MLANLALDAGQQEALQHVLVYLKAAAAASGREAQNATQLQDQVTGESAALKTVPSEFHSAQAAAAAAKGMAHEEHGVAELKQQLVKLECEADQVGASNQQVMQQQQQPDLLGRLQWSITEPVVVKKEEQWVRTEVKPSAAAEEHAQVQLSSLTQQLTKSQHRVKQLTQALGKLEIILKDFEAAAAEEKEHLVMQLSAANQQARQNSQQLQQLQQELTTVEHTQQMLEQNVKTLEVALAAAELSAAEAEEEKQHLQNALDEAQAVYSCSTAAASDNFPVPAAPQVIAMVDSTTVSSSLQESLASSQEQVFELQKQLAEAHTVKQAVDKELGRLQKQLTDDQAERTALEKQLTLHFEDTADYTAQDTVAAYVAKYDRLKSRYREITASHHDEVDGLHAEIGALQERVVNLEAAATQLDAARAQAQHGEAALSDALTKGSKAGVELATLRAENQQLMQSLVCAKLELAQLSEREVICKRELYKAKEINLKLASKMIKLETLVYK